MRGHQLQLPLVGNKPRDSEAARQALERAATRGPRRREADDEEGCPFELPEAAARPAPQAISERTGAQPARAELVAQARALAATLSDQLGRPVRLYVTDNRSTMVSFRRLTGGMVIRIHRMFLSAPDRVVRAIADYTGRGGRAAGTVIDEFVRLHSAQIRAVDPRRVAARLSTKGRVWDLQAMYDRLNAAFFGNGIEARIGWGRGTVPQRRRRTIRMGVYDHLTKTIRIHPALDRPEIPEFFVEYIVFHEMLHQAVPGKQSGGRRMHHGPEFRARERAYPGYDRAIAWERENLGLLLGKTAPKRARPVD